MRMKNIALLVLIVIADQIIKSWVRCFPPGITLFSFSPFLEIVHTINTGAAFSLFYNNSRLVLVLSVFLLSAVCIFSMRFMRLTQSASTALFCLIGGGIGNLLDRVLYKSVTDYIRLLFVDFPVFNLADVAITLSVFVLMFLILTGHLEEEGVTYGSNH